MEYLDGGWSVDGVCGWSVDGVCGWSVDGVYGRSVGGGINGGLCAIRVSGHFLLERLEEKMNFL